MDRTLFVTPSSGKRTVTKNAAGGEAFRADPKLALAKLIMVGTLGDNHYTKATQQLTELLKLCEECGPEFVARAAVYSRKVGNLKDIPVVLLAWLTTSGNNKLAQSIGNEVLDIGLQTRNYVQVMRSGMMGRKSLGSAARNLVRNYFHRKGSDELYKESHGSNPTMRDVLRLSKPRPRDVEKSNMLGYIVGKKPAPEGSLAQRVEQFNKGSLDFPVGAPFELIASACGNDPKRWAQAARYLSWGATFRNLNTFARHGVFKDEQLTGLVCARLKSRPPRHIMPWSLYAAYLYTLQNQEIPMSVKLAVQDALDNALQNTPEINGNTVICVDVSGSMTSAISGNRAAASKITCAQAAMLVAAAYVKRNPNTRIVTFSTTAQQVTVNPRDSVASIAGAIPFTGGGTNLSAALDLTARLKDVDNVLVLSDNESWLGKAEHSWKAVQASNPGVRIACLDMGVERSLQIPEGQRVMHLAGGFSDAYWAFIGSFFRGDSDGTRIVQAIEALEL